MLTVEQILQQHFKALTNGLINLTERHAADIVKLVLANSNKSYTVQLYRFNDQLKNYVPLLTIQTNLATVQRVRESLKVQWQGFYRFDLTDPSGLVIETFYTVNPALFD